jgi:anti-anti-sigma factor
VVDLTDCPFVDAATVGVFLDVHRQAWRAGGRLVLRSPSARLRRILHLARVDHVLYMTPAQPPPAPADHGPTPVEGPGPTSP